MVLWSPPRHLAGPVRPHALHRPPSRRAPVTAPTTVRAPGIAAGPRSAVATRAARPTPGAAPRAAASATEHGHPGLAAVATVGGPALWVAALAQVPAGTVRGLVLAAGWLGLASVLDRPGRRRRR